MEKQVSKFLDIIEHNKKNQGRKNWLTKNVFGACDFNIKFTYVLAKWEGTSFDSRILKDVLVTNDHFIISKC